MKNYFYFVVLVLLSNFNLSLLAAENKIKVSAQTFTAPEKWKSEKTSSSMRAAQFKISGKEGQESAECVFFYFGPGSAGGAKANLDRWANQFAKDPKPIFKVEQPKIEKVQVVYLFGEGTFMSGPPFGGAKVPKKNYGMAAAVLGVKPGYIFVKMTGPKEIVEKARPDFKKMVESGLK
ncbi:MAG: hypothetical protein QF406_09345 [Verrucomicrobiota bacterium]|jgi:hypothetical protein|nr:hypothetical protein [Verrucomicrobiota bacterium]